MSEEAMRTRCPECKGWGAVETGVYQNDGHGRQEYVYLGRNRCERCGGKGLIATNGSSAQADAA